MEAKYVIEPLDKQKHDRAAFSSGVVALDSYLKAQATQDTKKNIARTYVITGLDSATILGYYTLSTTSIEPDMLPDSIVRRLPRYNTFPAILIGRLAVSQHYQGQKLGRYLLLNALERCFQLSQDVGIMVVVVDAKDEGVASFYERYGFLRLVDSPLKLYLPTQEITLFI